LRFSLGTGGEQRRGRRSITYEFYDATYLALAPARWTAATTQLIFGNPFNPFAHTLPGRMMHASADVFSGLTKRRGKPAWNVGAAHEVVDARAFAQLVRFAASPQPNGRRVLIVAPLSGHYATLLRQTVRSFVGEHDVYVTDWADARDVPLEHGHFDLDDYIAYLIDWMRLLGPETHVVAVCQPVPAVLAAVAVLAADADAAQPRSMTLMGGPVDVRVAPTTVTEFADAHSLAWFEREVIAQVPAWYPGAGRPVYPGFLQLGAFMAMNPDRHVQAHWKIFEDLVRGDGESANARRAFYDEYLAVMDMTAEFYLQTVDVVFKRAALANGTMRWRGVPVDPSAIRTTALMTIEGELDDISAPGQTFAAHALCSAIPNERRAHLLQPGAGHYGIFSGTRWRTEIAPRIAEFIAAS
jgi:poly(3-hydroxybutyrate) depolymerase